MKIFVPALLLWSIASTARAEDAVTYEQRIEAQRAIERVYHERRIWPAENPGPRPPLDAVIPAERIRATVDDSLAKSELLATLWARPITGEQLQAEIDRIAARTKDPETLHRLLAALDNRPELVAECLVRPLLADRLIRAWYARDDRFHGELRRKAETLRRSLTAATFESAADGKYARVALRVAGAGSGSGDGVVTLPQQEFRQEAGRFAAEPGIIHLEETDDAFILRLTVRRSEDAVEGAVRVLRKVPFHDWFEEAARDAALPSQLGAAPPPGGYVLPDAAAATGTYRPDSWWKEPLVPQSRAMHTAVWTGTEMIVFGGRYTYTEPDTARYRPALDLWLPTATTNAPTLRYLHTAVWTGTEMIVWGGHAYAAYTTCAALGSGGRYNPLTDTWSSVSAAGAPAARAQHAAVWTGSEMLIWGGSPGWGTYLQSGGRYKPSTDTWGTALSTTNAPSGRARPSAIWTGDRMIVWGGYDGSAVGTGGRYDPGADTWTAVNPSGAPSARHGHSAVWSGSEMLVWGGGSDCSLGSGAACVFGVCGVTTSTVNTGARYNPATDAWTAIPVDANTPSSRSGHVAVWTGTEMIVWSGNGGAAGADRSDGARYRPATNAWVTMSSVSAPMARHSASVVWTGTEMIAWAGFYWVGGGGASGSFASGGRYNPTLDGWTPTAYTANGSQPRLEHAAAWTGAELVVWGGELYGEGQISSTNTGARYDPALDVWRPTTIAGAPQAAATPTAVWSRTHVIVWGGAGPYTNTGGRYNPASDGWSSTTTSGAPAARTGHTAVWTGSRMIVWGGNTQGGSYERSGGRYDPSTDTWADTLNDTGQGTPEGRTAHTAVWTGSRMIVWGGAAGANALDTGGRYDPVANTWAATTTTGAPPDRYYHGAVWTGSRMLVWGGRRDAAVPADPGGQYDPVGDTWYAMATTGSPSGRQTAYVEWTGTRMLVWSGKAVGSETTLSDGGELDPVANTWRTLPTANAPAGTEGRLGKSVWTGSELLLFGGSVGSTLAMYFPDTPPTSVPICLNPGATITLGPPAETLNLTHSLSLADWEDVEAAPKFTCSGCPSQSWHVVTAQNCSGLGDYQSPSRAWYFGDSLTCRYATSPAAGTLVSSSSYAVTAATHFTFRYYLDTDALKGDRAKVELSTDGGTSWPVVVAIDRSHTAQAPSAFQMDDTGGAWRGVALKLAPAFVPSGSSVKVRFVFDRDAMANDHVGWIVDDIGIGEPAGDGSNASTTIPYHDKWDRAVFQWDTDGNGIPNNTDTRTPVLDIPEASLPAYGLGEPGPHAITLKVTDSLGASTSANVNVTVLDGTPPTVAVASPVGGEYWLLSPSGGPNNIYIPSWTMSDNVRICRADVSLWYSSDGGQSYVAAPPGGGLPVSLGPGGNCPSPGYGGTSTVYTVPTSYPSGAPGSLYKLRVQVWDQSGNTATAMSPNPFFIVQTNPASVKTLILHNVPRMQAVQGITPAQASALKTKLDELAGHPQVAGVVVDLSLYADLPVLYGSWDADPWSFTKANDVLYGCQSCVPARRGIHDELLTLLQTYTNTTYLVLVGDDRIIPLSRVWDRTARPESTYLAGNLTSASTVGKALAMNRFLTDDPMGSKKAIVSADLATTAPKPIPDLRVGRLVERPEEMITTVSTFIGQNGVIDLTQMNPTTGHKVLLTGYDQYASTAYHAAAAWRARLSTNPQTFCYQPIDYCLIGSFSAATLRSHLGGFGGARYGVVNMNEHANHYKVGVPGSTPYDIQGLPSSDIYGADLCASPTLGALNLAGSVMYDVGSHGGLPVPGTCYQDADRSLDLPQTMMWRGVVAYVANTGYDWGLFHGHGYSQIVSRTMTEEVSRKSLYPVVFGDAFWRTKIEYFRQMARFDALAADPYHEKTRMQWTLYGLPMYSVRTGNTTVPLTDPPRRPLTTADGDRGPVVEPYGPVKVTRDLRLPGNVRTPPGGDVPPAYLTQLNLHFDFSAPGVYSKWKSDGITLETQPTGCSDPNGCFYTVNGIVAQASGEGDLPIQPNFTYDSRLSGTSQHGVLWMGGTYTEESGWKPVMGALNSNEGPLTNFGSAPRLSMLRGAAPRTIEGLEPANCAASDAEVSSLVVSAGQARKQLVTDPIYTYQRIYPSVDLEVLYYNNTADTNQNCDRTGPTLGAGPYGGNYHQVTAMTASFKVPASDANGVWRVIVVSDDGRITGGVGQWVAQELTNDGAGNWVGSRQIVGSTRLTYVIQAVDNRGNVTALEFVAAVPPESGSELDIPDARDIDLADGDGDGMPDAYEDQYACLSKTNGTDCAGALVPGDCDNDRLTSLQEFQQGTLPCQGDTDGGGDNDGSERNNGRSATNGADDKAMTITVTKVGNDYTVQWPPGLGDNGVIDGNYFVYRSTTPFFGSSNLIAGPLADGVTSHVDVNPPCATCYYRVWNVALALPPPVVSAVAPPSGTTNGGTTLWVFGTDFVTGAQVELGGVPATNETVVSSNFITCTTPPHAAGACAVRVINPNGQDGTLPAGYTYVCPAIAVSPTTLPDGTVGTPYSQTITASGGTAPYGFAVTAGTVPPGLGLTPAGLLSGNPTTSGPYNFTITATDANGCTGSRVYDVTIIP